MLRKLAFQNIRGNKGYFIAYIVTLSVFCTIVYQISNVQIALDAVINQGSELKEFKLAEVFGYLKTFIYIVIAFFTFYIARFFIKRRTKEIALLKTLGLSRFNIFKVFVIENVIVIFLATILGIVVSFLTARLFTFLALSMIGIDISNVSLSLLSKPVLDVIIIMIINFVIISLIPIRTISKISIVQLLQEDKKPDVINQKRYISISLFFIFLALLIFNAICVIPNIDGDSISLIYLLLYLVNATLLAVFLYKGFFINYFAKYARKHKAITNPNKIISYAHINQSSKSIYKIMTFISIITGMIIVLSIFIFGAINTILHDSGGSFNLEKDYYTIKLEDRSKKQATINEMKKANIGDVISLDFYPYKKVKLKPDTNYGDDKDIEDYTRIVEMSRRPVLLIKQSNYHKAFKKPKTGNFISNVNPNTCGKTKLNANYCKLIDDYHLHPKVDENLSKFFLGNFLDHEMVVIKENSPRSYSNYHYPIIMVVDDNSKLLNKLKPETLITYDQSINDSQAVSYSNLFFSKNPELRNFINPYIINTLTAPIIYGSFQLTFFIFAIVLLIALMMSMFFRTLESIELSLNDYIIAKRMGLTNKAINISLLTEIFIAQLLPFYFGIIASILLTRQLFVSKIFGNFAFHTAIMEPANMTFIIAILIVLHVLVVILMMIIKYEINHIKKIK